MKAIILAAGMGTRLRPITDNMPKCLIKIDDKTLLEYSLDNLKQNGINDVLIVIGYLGELIKEKIGKSYNGINVRYVENKEYSTTGHAYSLYLTKGDVADSAIIIEGDLLYGPDVVKCLLEHPENNVILTAELSGSGNAVPIYVDENNNLANLKHPQREDSKIDIKGKKLMGELVGITKFSKEFLSRLYKEIKKAYLAGYKDQHYEEAILETAKSVPVRCFLKKKLVWIEIDTQDDLKRAKEEIYPKLK